MSRSTREQALSMAVDISRSSGCAGWELIQTAKMIESYLEGTPEDWADEENAKEFRLCSEDPLYFMREFVKVQHPLKGAIHPEHYEFQERLVNAFHNNRFVISNTARQMGTTTCAAAFLLWKAMFTPDTTILICAKKLPQALEIMTRVRFAYENLPNHIRAGVTEYNKGSVTFDNGSRIIGRMTTPDAGRGLSITLLYMDDFAFMNPKISEEFWNAIRPSLATDGGCIISSTGHPKGEEGQFSKIWKKANENKNELGVGENGFFAIAIPWHEHPDRDEEWARTEREQLGDQRFEQEYECSLAFDEKSPAAE